MQLSFDFRNLQHCVTDTVQIIHNSDIGFPSPIMNFKQLYNKNKGCVS